MGGCHHRALTVCGQDVETACGLHVKHLVDEFNQLVGVSAQHIIEGPGLRTGLLAFFRLCQLLQRPLNQGQWGAQFMTHLGIEVKFLTLHPVALIIEAGGLQEVVIDTDDHQEQQEDQDASQDGDDPVGAELLHVGIGHILQT